jgi:hypothetical protein
MPVSISLPDGALSAVTSREAGPQPVEHELDGEDSQQDAEVAGEHVGPRVAEETHDAGSGEQGGQGKQQNHEKDEHGDLGRFAAAGVEQDGGDRTGPCE